MSASRYTNRTLPPYAFVPGESAHPTRDPAGHSYQEGPEENVESVEPECWQDSPDYLYGIDLYNAGFLWEAHEAWEGLWHVSKHDEVQAQFIQGLIQCTAGCLKIRMGQPRGMHKLFEAGLGRLRRVVKERGPHFMGVDLIEFTEAIEAFGQSAPSSPDERPLLQLE